MCNCVCVEVSKAASSPGAWQNQKKRNGNENGRSARWSEAEETGVRYSHLGLILSCGRGVADRIESGVKVHSSRVATETSGNLEDSRTTCKDCSWFEKCEGAKVGG